ncbi:MAG: hypothetical protein F4X72_03855 [Dehalococcoidia bacterium]|nr:hypothetical protein [Dehalococcoidia bacterium]
MTTIGQMPKPEAERFREDRKLLLVPLLIPFPGLPEKGQRILDRYWSDVREQIENMERRLGKIKHVYHEAIDSSDDGGLKTLDDMNPSISGFVRTLCRSGATMEATEDRALLEESTDWQRCLTIGLMSEKVLKLASDGYQESTTQRYEHIARRIDTSLGENEVGALFIGQDHRVQFPTDVQVFYVSPPSLDEYRRWVEEQMRAEVPTSGNEPEA